jgi:hypothetical protein
MWRVLLVACFSVSCIVRFVYGGGEERVTIDLLRAQKNPWELEGRKTRANKLQKASGGTGT